MARYTYQGVITPPSPSVAIVADAGDITDRSGTYYFWMQVRNRAGFSAVSPSVSAVVTVNARVDITIPSNLIPVANGMYIHSIYILANTTNNPATATIVCGIPYYELDEVTPRSLPVTIQLGADHHFELGKEVDYYSELPVNPCAGQRVYVEQDDRDDPTVDFNTIVEYQPFAAVPGWYEAFDQEFSTYLSDPTTASGALASISAASRVIPTLYTLGISANDRSPSRPIGIWLINDAAQPISVGTRVGMSFAIGEDNVSADFVGRMQIIFRGYVNTATGVNNTSDGDGGTMLLINEPIDYSGETIEVLKLQKEVPVGYAVWLDVRAISTLEELNNRAPIGARIKISPYFFSFRSTQTPPDLFGGYIADAQDRRLIVPGTGLTAKALRGSGKVQFNSLGTAFTFWNAEEQTIASLASNTADQSIVITKEGNCLLLDDVTNTTQLRAIVGTVNGVGAPSDWSSPIALNGSQRLGFTITHPVSFRDDYPDSLLAGQSYATYNGYGFRIYIRLVGGAASYWDVTTNTGSLTTAITIGGTAGVVGEPAIPGDTYFGLHLVDTFATALSTASTVFAAGSYEVCVAPIYQGTVSSINNDPDDGIITIRTTFAETLERSTYWLSAISDPLTLRSFTGERRGGMRVPLNNSSSFFYWDSANTDADNGTDTIAVTGVTTGRFKKSNNLSGHIITDDGTTRANRTKLNFAAALIATDNAGTDSIDITLDTIVTQQGNTFNGANQLVRLTNTGALPAISGSSLTGTVTQQGNTFNGANQLVQLTNTGALPAISGANLTNLPASAGLTIADEGVDRTPRPKLNFTGAIQAVDNAGLSRIDVSLESSVTTQGNTFNGANQLVRLNGSGALPALSGANLTGGVTLQGNTFNNASQLVKLDANGALPAVSAVNLTDLSTKHIVAYNSSPVADRIYLNFQGSSVSVVDDVSNNTTIVEIEAGTITPLKFRWESALSASSELTLLAPSSIATGILDPSSIAVSPDNKWCYVASPTSLKINQYSVGSNGQLTPLAAPFIAISLPPLFITISPDSKWLYATSSNSTTLNGNVLMFAINQATGTLTPLSVPSISTGINPRWMIIHPSGDWLYVSNDISDTISQYSIDRFTGIISPLVVPTVETGDNPFVMAIDPAGLFLYCTNTVSGSISQYSINQASGQLTALNPSFIISGGTSPQYIAISNSGTNAYVSFDNAIRSYSRNTLTGQLAIIGYAATAAIARGIIVSPGDTKLYVALDSTSKIRSYSIEPSVDGAINPNTWTDLAIGDRPSQIVMTSDSKWLYAISSYGDTVTQLSVGTLVFPVTAPPGQGELRFNNQNPGIATQLFFDTENRLGIDVSSIVASIAIGSTLTVVNEPNSAEALFTVNSITDNNTYLTLGVTPLGASGSFGGDLKVFLPTVATVIAPVDEIWINAGMIVPGTINGATENSYNTTIATYDVLDFDQTTEQDGFFTIVFGQKWNAGTIKAKFYWIASAGTGDCIWGIQAVSVSSATNLDQTFGTAQEVTQTLSAVDQLLISSATAAITIGNTPAVDDLIQFRVYRKAAAGGDTLSGTASLIGVEIQYTQVQTGVAW